MARHTATALFVLVTLVADRAATIEALRQQPVFRTGVDAVSIDVAVTEARRPVVGLEAQDFDLLDNNTRQSIGVVTMASVPIDVSVLLDVSGSALGDVEELKATAGGIRSHMRLADRFELVAFGSQVRVLVPLGLIGDEVSAPVRDLWAGTSLYDALAVALMRNADPMRRRLIVALTDGADTMSVMDLPGVVALAARSPFAVHLGLMRSNPVQPRGVRARLPFSERNIAGLDEVTSITGGQMLRFDQNPEMNALEVFQRILDGFRASYVLTYTPSGVDRFGEHRIEVRVPARPGAVVRHRSTYVLN